MNLLIEMNKAKGLLKKIISESKYIELRGYVWRLRSIRKRIKHKFQPLLFDDKYFLTYVIKKHRGFLSNIKEIKTLALRGSTTDFGFYSPLIEGSYNLGLTSVNFYTTHQIYKKYRYDLISLKNVVIYINPSVIGYFFIHTSSKYLSVVYRNIFDITYPGIDSLEEKYIKKINRKLDKALNIDSDIEGDYFGYETKTFPNDIDVESRVQTHYRENTREPDQIAWLEELSKLINEDGRKLFIVIPYFRSDYKALLPSEDVVFKKIFDAKLLNTEIVSYYNSSKFSDADMGDTDHMNEQGAIKITKLVAGLFN